MRQKLEEAKLNVAIQVGNAQFVDSARKPKMPISPDHKKKIYYGVNFCLSLSNFIISLSRFFNLTNPLTSLSPVVR